MVKTRRSPNLLWRLMRFLNQRVMPKTKPEERASGLVLLLITTGRKSGLLRETRLQYEEEEGTIYVAAARGQDADWFRNICAHPRVQVQIKGKRQCGLAEPITDPGRIADFLELRLKRHPQMVRAMLLAHGLVARPDRAHLEQLASKLALVAIRTDEGDLNMEKKQCEG
jgi:deazaflavin-dependent oxidoreductase (nitroreductase family)